MVKIVGCRCGVTFISLSVHCTHGANIQNPAFPRVRPRQPERCAEHLSRRVSSRCLRVAVTTQRMQPKAATDSRHDIRRGGQGLFQWQAFALPLGPCRASRMRARKADLRRADNFVGSLDRQLWFCSAQKGEVRMGTISRGFSGRRSAADVKLPPGQYLTTDFPVLSAGPTPHVPLDRWEFVIDDGTNVLRKWAVSYTHLTLPTICSV